MATACDVLGERWTLLLFRELLIQPCRFGQLNLWLRGMGTNLLSNRLSELETEGLIEKQYPENKRSAYLLTDKGRQVEPVILAFVRWGYQFATVQDDSIHYDHWDLLALKAFFNNRKGQTPLSVQFISDSLTAWVKVSEAGCDFGFGNTENPDLVLESNIQEFQRSLSYGLAIEKPLIAEFINWFDLPEKQASQR